MAAGKYTRAAARLLEVLDDASAAIAGGLAVNAHGYLRATRDVDVIVDLPPAEARRRLRAHGIEARLSRGNPLDGEFACVQGVIAVGARSTDAVPFDILPPLVPLRPDRMVDVVVRDKTLRVVDAQTLFALKARAGGVRDLYDMAMLVALHPGWKDDALAAASAGGRRVVAQLLSLMSDPRLAAQAREVRRQDEALRAFARRRARTK